MPFKILVFLLPVLVFGEIKVNIGAERTVEDCFVQVTGETTDILSELERETFQLNDKRLKDLVRIDDNYNWKAVKRTVRPIRAKVLSLRKEPKILKRDYHQNSNTNKYIYSGTIKKEMENTVSTTWSSAYGLTVGQPIKYSVGINGDTSFSFSEEWGSATSKSEATTFGSGSEVEFEVQPGATAIMELSASLYTLEVEVVYEATLNALYGFPVTKSRRSWGYIAPFWDSVLQEVGLPTSKFSNEIIKVEYYSDATVALL